METRADASGRSSASRGIDEHKDHVDGLEMQIGLLEPVEVIGVEGRSDSERGDTQNFLFELAG